MNNLYAITVLLHYYYSPEEHPDCAWNSEAWRAAITFLKSEGLLEDRSLASPYGASYQATERAKVYAEAIRDLPLPVQHWIIPERA